MDQPETKSKAVEIPEPKGSDSNGHRHISRDQALKAPGYFTKDVQVPELGEGAVIRVKNLTADERDEFEAQILEEKKNGTYRTKLKRFRCKLVVAAAIDEQGKMLFDWSDVPQLGAMNAAAVQRVFDAAAKLSGITDSDIEELVRDLGSAPSESGTSG